MDSEVPISTQTENVPAKPKKGWQGQKSRQRRTDAYRIKTNVEKNKWVEQKLSANRFDDVAADFEHLLNSIRTPEAHVEADIPSTTRGIGFNVVESFETANTISPGAAAAAQVDINVAYRVALLQLKAQQQQADLIAADVPKGPPFVNAEKQLEHLDEEVIQCVKATTHTFVNIATTINSFGQIKLGDRNYKTFQSAHLTAPLGERPRAVDRGRRRAAVIDELVQMLPNPFVVTINSLRDVVEALSDELTPLPQRNYFIAHNPIPGAVYLNGLLQNQDDIIPANYFENRLYVQDLRRWSNYVGACQRRMATLITSLSYSGEALPAALVSVPNPQGAIVNQVIQQMGRIITMAHEPFSKQQLLLGGFSLTGELPPEAQHVIISRVGYGVRDPFSQPVELEFSWQAVVRLYLTKR